jgi:uncharacterized protein with HEPN domain
MYDGEQARREWRCYVRDMKEFSERVLFYTRGLDIDSFVTDRRTYDATLRNIELIGEAATHVPPDVRESHPDVPWREIIGVRNRLAHGYLRIADSVIWSIVHDAVPDPLPELGRILDSGESQ